MCARIHSPAIAGLACLSVAACGAPAEEPLAAALPLVGGTPVPAGQWVDVTTNDLDDPEQARRLEARGVTVVGKEA